MTWDILIRRGTVIDGCGGPGTVSDIALATSRICNDRPRADGRERYVQYAAPWLARAPCLTMSLRLAKRSIHLAKSAALFDDRRLAEADPQWSRGYLISSSPLFRKETRS